jgi:Ca2+-binding RTX toxin-like protein
MDLVIHHALGSISSRYNSFSYFLNKTLASQKTAKASKTIFSLQPSGTSTTYSGQLTLESEGAFTLDSKNKKALVTSGTINTLKIRQKEGFLGLSGFDILTATNAEIDVRDLIVTGYSSKSAAGISRIFLKKSDSITGSQSDDHLSGYRGNDTLTGGLGADILMGGAGKDTFVYNSIDDSGAFTNYSSYGASKVGGDTFYESEYNDVIVDFRSGKDKIDLQNIKGITKKSLKIESISYELEGKKSATDLGSPYALWIDKDNDNIPEMVISFANTLKPLRMNDILI